MKQSPPLRLAALPLAVVLAWPAAPLRAQDRPSAAPAASAVSRTQVRKETAEANKAHRLEHGEAGDSSAAPPEKPKARLSTVNRSDVKKDTAVANKAHRLEHGEAGDSSAAPPDKAQARLSTVKRADVKKETAAANKAGTLPHGEQEAQPSTKP